MSNSSSTKSISKKKPQLDEGDNDNEMKSYSFYLRTAKTPPIRYLMELLRDLLSEGSLRCSPEGIKLMEIDSHRVVLIHTKLDATKFEDFYCPKPIILGLNIEDTFKIIKNMDNTDTLKLFVKKDDNNRLGIETFSKDENTWDTTYINLMDLRDDEVTMPDMTFDNQINMPSNRFQRICRSIYNFSDKIELQCVKSQLTFKGCNTNVKQEIKIKPTPNGLKFVQNEKPDEIIQGIFNLKYLMLFSKCSNLDSIIQIHIKNDLPLVLKCNVANLGEIKLCLAPQMEE